MPRRFFQREVVRRGGRRNDLRVQPGGQPQQVQAGRLALRPDLRQVCGEQAVYERIGQVLRVPGQAESLVSAVTNTVGETVYVYAVPSGTLARLAAQLDGPGDAVIAALTIAYQFLLTLPIAKEEGTHPAWSVASLAPDTRLPEVIREIPVVAPQHAMR